MYDEADETKEESDVVAVLFFVREMDKSVLDSSISFFDDKYVLQFILHLFMKWMRRGD